MVCTNRHLQGGGHAQGIFINPENFTGNTEFDSIVNDTPTFATAETQEHWIGEHCIAVNPLQ